MLLWEYNMLLVFDVADVYGDAIFVSLWFLYHRILY